MVTPLLFGIRANYNQRPRWGIRGGGGRKSPTLSGQQESHFSVRDTWTSCSHTNVVEIWRVRIPWRYCWAPSSTRTLPDFGLPQVWDNSCSYCLNLTESEFLLSSKSILANTQLPPPQKRSRNSRQGLENSPSTDTQIPEKGIWKHLKVLKDQTGFEAVNITFW